MIIFKELPGGDAGGGPPKTASSRKAMPFLGVTGGRTPRQPRLAFFGTSGFGIPILEALHRAFGVVLVVTTPDKPAGRGRSFKQSRVAAAAGQLNLPTIKPVKAALALSHLRAKNIDFIVLAAYGKILPKEILDYPARGALNVHPSLLPRLRGASPIQQAILDGARETGLSIILMTEQVDAGPVLASKTLELTGKERYTGLEATLAKVAADFTVNVVRDYLRGKIKPQPQEESGATFTRLLKKEDGFTDFSEPAEIIECKIRAYEPWPGVHTIWRGKVLKILEAEYSEVRLPKEVGLPGLVCNITGELHIKCAENSLKISKIQLEGGRPMTGREFLAGHGQIIGEVLPN